MSPSQSADGFMQFPKNQTVKINVGGSDLDPSKRSKTTDLSRFGTAQQVQKRNTEAVDTKLLDAIFNDCEKNKTDPYRTINRP